MKTENTSKEKVFRRFRIEKNRGTKDWNKERRKKAVRKWKMANRSHWVFKLLSQPKKEKRKGKKGKRKKKSKKRKEEREKNWREAQQNPATKDWWEWTRVVMSSVEHCVDTMYPSAWNLNQGITKDCSAKDRRWSTSARSGLFKAWSRELSLHLSWQLYCEEACWKSYLLKIVETERFRIGQKRRDWMDKTSLNSAQLWRLKHSNMRSSQLCLVGLLRNSYWPRAWFELRVVHVACHCALLFGWVLFLRRLAKL